MLSQVAPSDATVLITGESGTGKELIAAELHRLSRRTGAALVKINCAALPESIIESELFGHEKGAFTGAIKERKGRFEMADKGTIFLDEIGELSPQVQVKLLRVLQERELERVGGTATIKVDVRLIAATNRNLEAEVKAGRFREDLYYRLNVFPLHIPPLRERKSDLILLADYFAEKYAEKNGKLVKRISTPALDLLISYSWPGNVRELERVGGTNTIRVDVRLITATNRNLETEVKAGRFREDLYYRLNVFPLHVPPLRERKSDLVLLADFFSEKYAEKNGKLIKRISMPALDLLTSYSWPGNVRELENCMERAVILSTDTVIHAYNLPPSLQSAVSTNTEPTTTLEAALSRLEKELIIEALKIHDGNMAAAARQLGVSERQIGLRVHHYGINWRLYRATKM
jgi:transcriptional regulator with GAF, ATPase, and Fis domain